MEQMGPTYTILTHGENHGITYNNSRNNTCILRFLRSMHRGRTKMSTKHTQTARPSVGKNAHLSNKFLVRSVVQMDW